MERLYWDAINVDDRKIFYTVTEKGLNFVGSPEHGVSQVLDFYDNDQFEYVHAHSQTDHYRKSLKRYLKGKRDHLEFNVDYLVDGTPQQETVWRKITTIPYGETRSLATLAAELDLDSGEVLDAMKKCPVWIAIPLHRVVDRGETNGFRTDVRMQQYLREIEQKPKSDLKELL